MLVCLRLNMMTVLLVIIFTLTFYFSIFHVPGCLGWVGCGVAVIKVYIQVFVYLLSVMHTIPAVTRKQKTSTIQKQCVWLRLYSIFCLLNEEGNYSTIIFPGIEINKSSFLKIDIINVRKDQFNDMGDLHMLKKQAGFRPKLNIYTGC